MPYYPPKPISDISYSAESNSSFWLWTGIAFVFLLLLEPEKRKPSRTPADLHGLEGRIRSCDAWFESTDKKGRLIHRCFIYKPTCNAKRCKADPNLLHEEPAEMEGMFGYKTSLPKDDPSYFESDYEPGDLVEYKGEIWEVGFVNQRNFKGTLRLQRPISEGQTESINKIYPEDVKPVREIPMSEYLYQPTWKRESKVIPESRGQMTLFGIEDLSKAELQRFKDYISQYENKQQFVDDYNANHDFKAKKALDWYRSQIFETKERMPKGEKRKYFVDYITFLEDKISNIPEEIEALTFDELWNIGKSFESKPFTPGEQLKLFGIGRLSQRERERVESFTKYGEAVEKDNPIFKYSAEPYRSKALKSIGFKKYPQKFYTINEARKVANKIPESTVVKDGFDYAVMYREEPAGMVAEKIHHKIYPKIEPVKLRRKKLFPEQTSFTDPSQMTLFGHKRLRHAI